MSDATRNDLRLLLIAALVNAGLFAATLSCLTVGYESNDDIGMAHIVSGISTGKPSEEIVFSNILIGRGLKWFYEQTDRVNWYACYLASVHFLSMTGLLYAFLRTRNARSSVLLYVILFTQFELALLLFLQFTSTAALAGVAGLLLIVSSTSEETGPSWRASLYGGALVVLSAMIRSDSFYFAVALMSPLLAYEFCGPQTWGRWRHIWTESRRVSLSRVASLKILFPAGRGIPLVLCIAFALGMVAYNARHYESDRRWRDFFTYTKVRAAIHDLPIVEYSDNTRFFFDRIGWSRNDWGMFRSWFFSDARLFSREKMQALLDLFQKSSWSRPTPELYLEASLKSITEFSAMMWANVMLAVVLCRDRRMTMLLLGLAEALLVEGLLLFFSRYAKLPIRVVLPALFSTSIVAFYFVLKTESENRYVTRAHLPRIAQAASAVVTALLCALYAVPGERTVERLLVESDANARDQRAYRVYVRTLCDRYAGAGGDAVFLNWGGMFPMQFVPPFDNLREFRPLKMLGLGWNTHSPPFNDSVRRWRLGDLYRATYENPNVYLFSAPIYLKQLEQFAFEHHQKAIHVSRNDAYLIDDDFPAEAGAYSLTVFQMAAGQIPADSPAEKFSAVGRHRTTGHSP